ncbi:hypothetical protein [Priestia abyssalis]|uniref:hypothetical protein n=1 Tax=Priestia abyssalis TaxID=1221450 RepID=UPI0014733185|nr:hypothetical protein [Priestia abyssalis]
MICDEEMALFIKEFGHLLDQYQKCEEGKLKKAIYEDILLLGSVIDFDINNE